MSPNSKLDWTLRVVLAVALVLMGIIPKFTSDPTLLANFQRWGYPDGFHFVIGAGETLGVILLLMPRTVLFGALLIDVLMTGAVATHLRAGEYAFAPVPLTLGVVALVIAWPRIKAWRAARAAG